MLAIWRHLINDEAQSSNDATWRKELPNAGALHAILLTVKCTNGSTSGRNVDIFDVVDEIVVKGNGSEVLFSLYPTELEKWYETLFGRPLQIDEDMGASAVQRAVFPILFGREIYDPEYFLRLSAFQDVTLEVKYSPSIAADAGFATGTTTFDVELLITPEDGSLPYQGMLVTRRIKSYTTVASGEEEVDLPGNTVIRAIGNYVYEAGVADGSNVTKVVLEDVASGLQLFTGDWENLLYISRELFGAEISHSCKALLATNETWNCRIGEVLSYSCEVVETADATNDEFDSAFIDDITGDQLTVDAYNVDITAGSETITAASGDVTLYLSVKGISPSYFGVIPFMYQDEPAGWFNTGQGSKFQVVHTNGNAGGSAYVSIQEYRRY